MILLRIFWLGLMLGGLSSCSLMESDKVSHATDILDDFFSAAENGKLEDAENYNRSALASRQFKKPLAKSLPHGKQGLLSEMALPSKSGVSPATQLNKPSQHKKAVEFDFKDIELRELINLFFDEYLKVPYTYLDDFKSKKVNFVFRGKVNRKELMKVFEAFLKFHGVAIKFNEGVYAITSVDNKTITLPAYDGVGDTIGIFKCRYINAQDFLTAGRLLLSEKQNAIVLDDQNMVFLKGSQAEVDAFKRLYKSLDVPYFEGKHLLIYGARYLKASALKVLVEKFEHTLGSKAQHPKKRLEVEELPDHFRLVIVAADEEAKKLVLDYLARVDVAGKHEREMFQYPLSNQNATEVLGTVNSLLEPLAKNTQPITVVADKLTNSLFFMATAEEYVVIKRLLHSLDFRIPAVHIDMVVAEVTLKDHAGYGVEWFLNKTTGSVATDATLDMLSNSAIAGATGGLSLGAVALNSNKFVRLKLLADTTDFKVLSNPHLLVKNGSTASINVGGNIAVPASKTDAQSNSGGPVTQTNFNREDVSLKLEVTPKISMEGVIQLAITLNDKSFTGNDAAGQPKFSKRDLTTELVFEDGQTLFLGGLIRRKKNEVIKKVPFFGDVPYLGNLFRNKDVTEDVTELIMLITPRLVLDKEGAALVSKALMESEKNVLKDFKHKALFSKTKELLQWGKQ